MTNISHMKISTMHWNRTMDLSMLNRATNQVEKVRVDLPPGAMDQIKAAIREELKKMKVKTGGDVWVESMSGFITKDPKEEEAISDIMDRMVDTAAAKNFEVKPRK
ncbi:hypothetical protein [Sinorhizobium meliloti]|uniref:hypothetical protein n=1 Tax=Rhizobium meliloti TaxID=382 RepID=UPI0012953C80|nr:hypothetical protein [Sinorhizobium meliloti]MDX0698045.1 hypothetical protein [Sinorhizobium medicae]MDX0747661.1 hypothetical protein [Sinorhizobium medicae]MQX93322.1 hypothetical protein [Sinorhizobium meliloti]